MSELAPVVHVVDDDAAFLKAVTRLLKAQGYTVRSFACATEFLQRPGSDAPGCVVTDLRMPGMDGLDLQRAMSQRPGALPIVFLSGEGDIPTTVRAMRHGAEDFLTKSAPKEELFAAIDRAIARDSRQRAEDTQRRTAQDLVASLTPRERFVLLQVIAGRLNKQIAGDLDVSERMVKIHRTAITTKLQRRSVAELALLAQAAGLLDS
jgi:two-component system, LuxR family, response regulator FixJ